MNSSGKKANKLWVMIWQEQDWYYAYLNFKTSTLYWKHWEKDGKAKYGSKSLCVK